MRTDHVQYFPLALQPAEPDRLDILDTLLSSGIFTECLLGGKGEYRYSFAKDSRWSKAEYNRNSVHAAVAVCQRYGVKPILVRHLWPDLPGQEPSDHMFAPKFYARRWREIAADAELFDMPWVIDIEPQLPEARAQTAVHLLIKSSLDQHKIDGPRMAMAMGKGAMVVSQPQYVFPAATQHAAHIYSQLGDWFPPFRRIAMPPNYDLHYAYRVEMPHGLMQVRFAVKASPGHNTVAGLAAAARRIMVYCDTSDEGFANALAERPWELKEKRPRVGVLERELVVLKRRVTALEELA